VISDESLSITLDKLLASIDSGSSRKYHWPWFHVNRKHMVSMAKCANIILHCLGSAQARCASFKAEKLTKAFCQASIRENFWH
jgi:hypothetical protein